MLQNCSIWRTASVFFREPTREHYVKEISRRIGLAHTSVRRHVDELVGLGLLERRVVRRGTRDFPVYLARRDSPLFKHYKRLHNLDSLRELASHLADALMPQCIVLFGSYRRGEDMEGSDIDLFVQREPEELDLSPFESRLGRKIQLHFRSRFDSCAEELMNNIANGIVLHGYLVAYDRSGGTGPAEGAGAPSARAGHARAARGHGQGQISGKHAHGLLRRRA